MMICGYSKKQYFIIVSVGLILGEKKTNYDVNVSVSFNGPWDHKSTSLTRLVPEHVNIDVVEQCPKCLQYTFPRIDFGQPSLLMVLDGW